MQAQGQYRVTGLYCRHVLQLEGVDIVGGDLSRPGEAARIIGMSKPDWVVHCAAATNVDDCEHDPETAFRLNRDMAYLVAEAAHAGGARFVHISTDAVFDGKRGDYTERDAPNPINVYGRSKLEGEQAVLDANPDALVIRTNLYGWSAQPKKSLAEWFLANLESGNSCYGFADISITPILATDLAGLILQMLEKDLHGHYHVAGGECINKYEFGVKLARTFDLDPDLIQRAGVEKAGLAAPRPNRLCLSGEKIEQTLGINLPGLEHGLGRLKSQRETNYPDQLKAVLSPPAAQTIPADLRSGPT
jgi:dTDP-4-dehydrorhamnose reductase